jgi:nitrile hydratase accessory protein
LSEKALAALVARDAMIGVAKVTLPQAGDYRWTAFMTWAACMGPIQYEKNEPVFHARWEGRVFALRRAMARFPRDKDRPVFAEPWEAQAFALAVKLSEQGHFTWKEWAAALAGEIKAASSRGEPDDGSRYYHHWLAALERLVTAKGLADSAALVARKEAWAEAYRRTPHGKPIKLAGESRGEL